MPQILTVSAKIAAILSDVSAVFTNIAPVLAQILPVSLDVSVSFAGLGEDCRREHRHSQRECREHNPFSRCHDFLLGRPVFGLSYQG
jgi:hypothetical protein